MKKVIAICFFSLMVLGSIIAAPKKAKILQLDPIEFDLVSSHNGRFEYVVDPRIEVMTIICRITGAGYFNWNYSGENPYLSQVDTFFAKYKDEPAVKTALSYISKGIGMDAFISLAYHIKPDFSGTIDALRPLPETLDKSWKQIGANTLNSFVKQIHAFVIKSNFVRFYNVNRSDYLSFIGWYDKEVEEKNMESWAKDFFTGFDIGPVTFSVNRPAVGFNFYDYAQDSEGIKKAYITTYPGSYFADMTITYFSFYLQPYVNENWDAVKDNFTKYIKYFAKKTKPDAKDKEIEKMEVTQNDLVSLMGMYCFLGYLEDSIPTAKEDDEYYKPTYDAYCATYEKLAGDAFNQGKALITEYKNNRDKYADFKAFYPKITEYINSIKTE